MAIGSKVVWLGVVVMGVVVASSAALLKQPESGRALLVPLGDSAPRDPRRER